MGLSKFDNDLKLTPENISSNWKSSGELNPYRSKISTSYASQLDVLVVAVLNKGKTLPYDAFIVYLKNLSKGIVTLGKQPTYASNADIQNSIGYLTYEIDDTAKVLEKSHIHDFVSKISDVINSTGSTGTDVVAPPIISAKINSFSGTVYKSDSIGICRTGPNVLTPCN